MSREQGSKRDSRQRTVQAAGGGRMCGVLDGRGTQGRPQLGPLKTLAWLHCTIHWHVGNTTACLRERVAARKTARRGEGEVATRRGARNGPRARRQPSHAVCSVPACAVQASLLPAVPRPVRQQGGAWFWTQHVNTAAYCRQIGVGVGPSLSISPADRSDRWGKKQDDPFNLRCAGVD